MATIIVGHFDQVEDLWEAMRLLEGLGFRSTDYAAYYLNPPGHCGVYLLAHDIEDEEGSSLGASVGNIGEPAGPGVGAYLGMSSGSTSLAAASPTASPTGSHFASANEEMQPSGPMLAIRAAPAAAEAIAVAILGHSVARRINRAQGRWEHGSWIELDRREPVMQLLQCDP